MAFLGDVYDYELCWHGITYCDDHTDGDRLVIAPALKGRAERLDAVRIYESPISNVDYLRIGGDLIGVSYLNFGTYISLYLNAKLPACIPMSWISQVVILSLIDPRDKGRLSESEFLTARQTFACAEELIRPLPPIPEEIVVRIREHVAESHIQKIEH